jgi:hypothetical protein
LSGTFHACAHGIRKVVILQSSFYGADTFFSHWKVAEHRWITFEIKGLLNLNFLE